MEKDQASLFLGFFTIVHKLSSPTSVSGLVSANALLPYQKHNGKRSSLSVFRLLTFVNTLILILAECLSIRGPK